MSSLSLPGSEPDSKEGTAYFELGKPLSSLSSHGARRERKPDESHANTTGGQPLN
jgi:hypothetical protein